MLLAAGFGTRLRPLTDALPKPLVPIGDRSVAAHISHTLAAAGYRRLVANVHHLPEAWDAAALAALALPTEIVVETRIRGTAGGVFHAADRLGDGEVLVHGGDILVDLDVAALRDAHRAHQALATLAVVGGRAPGEGTVGLGDDGRIVRLRAGRFGDEVQGADFVGVQLLSAEARARLVPDGCLVADLYLPALAEGARVMAAPVARAFRDVGTPAAYLAANLAWLEARGMAYHIGPDADVDAAVQLTQSIVGAGATVRGRGRLERCVVWPGAVARAPLRDTVVTAASSVRC